MRGILLFAGLTLGIVVAAVSMGCDQATSAMPLPVNTLSSPNQPTAHTAQLKQAAGPNVQPCLVPGEDDNKRAWCLLQQLVTTGGTSSAGGEFNLQGWQVNPKNGMNQFQCPASTGGQTLLQQPNVFLQAMRTPLQIKEARGAKKNAAGNNALLPSPGKPSQSDAGLATSQIGAILYNTEASESICDYLLNSKQSDLDHALSAAAAQKAPANAVSLQPGSVVIKTIWAEVPNTSRFAVLAIWDPSAAQVLSIDPWQTQVHLNYSLSQISCQFQPPSNPDDYKNTAIQVSPGCFYSVPVSAVARNSFRSNVKSVNNVADFDNGARYVLLGFHVAAKGPQGWTWQTYWWSAQSFKAGTDDYNTRTGNPFFDPTNPGQPKNAFGNYIMKAKSTGPLSNPYLEARLKSGNQSNCTTCHDLASFHPKTDSNNQDCLFTIASQDIGSGLPPTKQCKPLSPPAPGFATDKLWSLADLNVTTVTNGGSQ